MSGKSLIKKTNIMALKRFGNEKRSGKHMYRILFDHTPHFKGVLHRDSVFVSRHLSDFIGQHIDSLSLHELAHPQRCIQGQPHSQGPAGAKLPEWPSLPVTLTKFHKALILFWGPMPWSLHPE